MGLAALRPITKKTANVVSRTSAPTVSAAARAGTFHPIVWLPMRMYIDQTA
jgi:hypothetical protein